MAILKQIDFEEPGWASLTSGPQNRLSYRQQILADSPKGYWPLDETSGTMALDQSGNNRHGQYWPSASGTWTGGTLGQTGPLYRPAGQCPLFNGSSGYVRLPDTLMNLATATSTISIEFWFKYVSNSKTMFAAWDPNPYQFLLAAGYPNNTTSTLALCTVGKSNFWEFPLALAGNPWVCFACTIDSDKTVRLYANGVQVSSFNHGFSTGFTSSYVCLGVENRWGPPGSAASNRFFNGHIAHMAIYPQCLTADRIKAHYRTAVGQ